MCTNPIFMIILSILNYTTIKLKNILSITTEYNTISKLTIMDQIDKALCNIPASIISKIGSNLHLKKYHPIEIIRHIIYCYFGESYAKFDDLSPYVSVEDNFDKLLIPTNHPARSPSDTYYLNETMVLRTHTSAHQSNLLSKGYTKFLVTGDVYRKDEIDKSHYPVFHQMEGVCVVDGDDAESQLKSTLAGLVQHLFPDCEYRLNNDYFPFTKPSFEIEVRYENKWLEILGCGIVQPAIMINCGLNGKQAWAFGLGLERLAMILFGISDIRYFWCKDELFLNQFTSYDIVQFKPYSKLASLTKDISFWIDKNQIVDGNPIKWSSENDFYQLCREICNDMIEKVELFDEFCHPKTGAYSRAYHIVYSCPNVITNPSEFNDIVNNIHASIGSTASVTMNLALR